MRDNAFGKYESFVLRTGLRSCIASLVVAWGVWNTAALAAQTTERVDFTNEIRPLLSDHCFACHGPDDAHREGGFRLDDKESAFGVGDSGATLIVAGQPDQSLIIARILETDPNALMPPAEHNKPLTPEQIELLKRWISEGAEWSEHWSFQPVQKPTVPEVQPADWARDDLDRFVLERISFNGLHPNPPASKIDWLRRVTFDLTGLPPSLAEVQEFLADDSSDAYERVVDRLLASEHYGEHMSRFWLDAARYGDTHGLHLDNYREMWLYRDWVIRAFNSNMPYDQFLTEQLAGDLLENPTEDQLIATGFNRCHVTTNEGGSIVEEVEMRNVVDRVVTTGTVFMGLTLDCTRCHDHKFDPLTMTDFYGLYGFFNSMDGSAMDGNIKDPAPVLKVLTEEQRAKLAELDQVEEKLRASIAQQLAGISYVEPENVGEPMAPQPTEYVWIEDSLPPGVARQDGWNFVGAPNPVYSGETVTTRTAQGLSQHYFEGASQPLKVAEGDVLFAYVYLDPNNPPKEIMLQFNDGSWEHRAFWGGDHIEWGNTGTPSRLHRGVLPALGEWVRLEVPAAEVGLQPGAMINGWAFTQFDGTTFWDKAGIVSINQQNPTYDSFERWLADQNAAKGAGVPDGLKAAVSSDLAALTPETRDQLFQHFLEYVYVATVDQFRPLHEQLDQLAKSRQEIQAAAPTTLIYREKAEPVPAHYLKRGEYDQVGDQVQRSTPRSLPPLPEGAPVNRLGLAQWLVHPTHPLTARVAVNRFWQQVFGTGIVKTSEDFGSQGSPPSHPLLLDYMSVEFRESGWNIKQLMKRMVLSSTYRQSSYASEEAIHRDPSNRWLARGPRYRLDAEMLRDQALSLSGLLVNRIGGPGVKPPQPDLWIYVGYSGSNTVRFVPDTEADKIHRRTIYTFFKRTAPPPQMSTFDAPSREACVVRRERTNTPLQALLLLNDPQYFEAARAFAGRVLREAQASDEARASYMFELATCRKPSAEELQELVALVADQRQNYEAHPEDATKVVGAMVDVTGVSVTEPEIAAWTILANLILNLDEVINKN